MFPSAHGKWRIAVFLAFALEAAPSLADPTSPHGDLPLACDRCHSESDWRVGREFPFRHDSTGYDLTGAHAVAACSECHASPIFSRVGIACADCHRDPHQGELGLDCGACHGTRRWESRSEMSRNHSRTLFPLFGGHARIDCEACHADPAPRQFALTPTDCIACHRADYEAAASPPHRAYPLDCRPCHGSIAEGWRAPGFSHPDRFPLTGDHGGLSCEQCHARGYAGTSAACDSCHSDGRSY
jgi:hypothetical protein